MAPYCLRSCLHIHPYCCLVGIRLCGNIFAVAKASVQLGPQLQGSPLLPVAVRAPTMDPTLFMGNSRLLCDCRTASIANYEIL
jgi:hypothetical protein